MGEGSGSPYSLRIRMRNHLSVQLGLDSEGGDKGDVCVLESLCPYAFSVQEGENTGKSRMELTWSFLSRSNLRLDSHGTVPGLGNSRDLGNRTRGFGAMIDGEPRQFNCLGSSRPGPVLP